MPFTLASDLLSGWPNLPGYSSRALSGLNSSQDNKTILLPLELRDNIVLPMSCRKERKERERKNNIYIDEHIGTYRSPQYTTCSTFAEKAPEKNELIRKK